MLSDVFFGCKLQIASAERLLQELGAQQTKARSHTTLSTMDIINAVKICCERAAASRAEGPRPSLNRVLEPNERLQENGGPDGGPAGDPPPELAAVSGGEDAEDDDSQKPRSRGGPWSEGRQPSRRSWVCGCWRSNKYVASLPVSARRTPQEEWSVRPVAGLRSEDWKTPRDKFLARMIRVDIRTPIGKNR